MDEFEDYNNCISYEDDAEVGLYPMLKQLNSIL